MIFPPVSVARTCKLIVSTSGVIDGAITEKSQGKETSLVTTSSFKSNSALRTCTSSEILASTDINVPSSTCIPGLVVSMSILEISMVTVGACP